LIEGRTRVEVALPLPIYRTFSYEVHGEAPLPGTRVLVPFRRQELIGWITADRPDPDVQKVKAVLGVLEDVPSVTPDLMELCGWMAEYYVAPLGIAIRASIPAVLSDVSRDYLSLTGLQGGDLSNREKRLLEWLSERKGPQRVKTTRNNLGIGSIWPEVRSLIASGHITHETVSPQSPSVKTRRVVRIVRSLENLLERDQAFGRGERQREAFGFIEAAGKSVELARLTKEEGFSRGVVTALTKKGLVEVVDEEEIRDPFAGVPQGQSARHTPTDAQQIALNALLEALDERDPKPFLLQGVTGSGKTLVYIELLREALKRGQTAIVLVPEIALTPQTVSRFRAHFGDEVAVLHSGLSSGERYDAWRMLRRGERRIAVGARSALFAPIENIGVIVVDEEHDSSYKQSEAPRYHARDLAVMRARAHGAVCVLGSATPSLETWHNSSVGKFSRLVLPERAGGGRLPLVQVIDLRAERKKEKSEHGAKVSKQSRGSGVLTEDLVEAVDLRIARSEQVILLLNRRGYSSFVQCRECGEVEQCENCSVSLTYHRVTQRIVCHHCRFEAVAPSRCTRCGSTDLSFRGLGTEQVEQITAEAFPEARIARMDVDTTSGKWAHQRILERVGRGEIDILLGTQMIAKGLDFPRVTLVGVVNADTGMHLPDFRASERTFQLLSQVAGRAGRSELGGEVIIQTSLPEHYAVRAAVSHDFESFALRELRERKSPLYPPHLRIINVVFSSPDQRLALQASEEAANWVREGLAKRKRAGATEQLELVGPAPAPIEKLHGRWRWHFFLRSDSPPILGTVARALVERLRLPAGDIRLTLDRDPVALL
jgi:primosomal protein N' (replication factor Y)